MLRRTQKVQETTESRKDVRERKGRFQIVKLEERIAPRIGYHYHNHNCHYNPQGKYVGCGQGRF